MAKARNDDLQKALRLFDGKLVLRRNKGATYTEPHEGLGEVDFDLSEQEAIESRAAIVRLLQFNQVSEELRGRLWGVFAPDGDEAAGHRRADLSFRSGNRPADVVRPTQLILEVALLRHKEKMTLAEAQEIVAARHGMKGGVKSIWNRHKDLRETIQQSLPPQK